MRTTPTSSLFSLSERAEVVARTAFAKEWESLTHAARVEQAAMHLALDRGYTAESVEKARAVAWLHDVVEDTHVETVDLVDIGFPLAVVNAVGLLSRTYGSEYAPYVKALLAAEGEVGRLARLVKLADARENLARCEAALGVPKWQRLAAQRYRPLVESLEAAGDV